MAHNGNERGKGSFNTEKNEKRGYYRESPEDPEGSEGYTARDPRFTNNLYAEKGNITTNTSTIEPRNIMFPVLFDAKFRDEQLANVSVYQLKPSEPSAMNVGCSSVNTASRANDSVATTIDHPLI